MMSLNLKGIRGFADIPIECNSHQHNKTVTMGIVNHGDETMNNLISHTSLFDPFFIESILPQYLTSSSMYQTKILPKTC